MSDVFYSAHDYEASSEPFLGVKAHEADIWPVADNSGSGTKDAIGDGLHPVVAIGGRTVADGRPRNVVGVVVAYEAGLTTATGMVTLNVAPRTIVKNYVANVLTYAAGVPATFEQAPVVGQPVYVDDSNDLGEGVTLSMSPLNDADVANPMAGVLFYCQDEYADAVAGGANSSPTFDTSLANELVEQAFCVMLHSDQYYEAPA
jgi:hypothetical protein